MDKLRRCGSSVQVSKKRQCKYIVHTCKLQDWGLTPNLSLSESVEAGGELVDWLEAPSFLSVS